MSFHRTWDQSIGGCGQCHSKDMDHSIGGCGQCHSIGHGPEYRKVWSMSFHQRSFLEYELQTMFPRFTKIPCCMGFNDVWLVPPRHLYWMWMNRACFALIYLQFSEIVCFIGTLKGTILSRSEQTFNRAWNWCPSLRWTQWLKITASTFMQQQTVIMTLWVLFSVTELI